MVIEAPFPLHFAWKVAAANPSLEALKHKVAFLFPSLVLIYSLIQAAASPSATSLSKVLSHDSSTIPKSALVSFNTYFKILIKSSSESAKVVVF